MMRERSEADDDRSRELSQPYGERRQMSEIDPLQALTIFVAQYPNQLHAARELGISPAYLSDLLRGNRAFSDRILDKLGLKRVIMPNLPESLL